MVSMIVAAITAAVVIGYAAILAAVISSDQAFRP
jgi:hypothetical protein